MKGVVMNRPTNLGFVQLPRVVKNPYKELDLSKLDRRICDEIIDETAGYRRIFGKASSREIAKRLNDTERKKSSHLRVSHRTISRHLRSLVERDILIRCGSTNRTRYGMRLYVDYRNSSQYEVKKRVAVERRAKRLEAERVERKVYFKGSEPATEEQIRVTLGGIRDCWNAAKKALTERVNPGHKLGLCVWEA